MFLKLLYFYLQRSVTHGVSLFYLKVQSVTPVLKLYFAPIPVPTLNVLFFCPPFSVEKECPRERETGSWELKFTSIVVGRLLVCWKRNESKKGKGRERGRGRGRGGFFIRLGTLRG